MASLSAPMAFEGWWLTFGHAGQAFAAGLLAGMTGIEEIRKAHDEKGYFGLRMSAHQSYIYVQLW